MRFWLRATWPERPCSNGWQETHLIYDMDASVSNITYQGKAGSMNEVFENFCRKVHEQADSRRCLM